MRTRAAASEPSGSTARVEAELPPAELLKALQAVSGGDFSVRLPGEYSGIAGKIADTFNRIVAANPGLIPVVKGNGYGFGRQNLAAIAAQHPPRMRPAHPLVHGIERGGGVRQASHARHRRGGNDDVDRSCAAHQKPWGRRPYDVTTDHARAPYLQPQVRVAASHQP